MKVLKFGGTSVANADAISQLKNIVASLNSTELIIVVSALGGVTDRLEEALALASTKQEGYKDIFAALEERHIELTRQLFPVKEQGGVLARLKGEFNTLETLLEGSYLIGEETPRLRDLVMGYGELLSSELIAGYLVSQGLKAQWADSRKLIKTDDQFGRARVNKKETYANLQAFAEEQKGHILLAPGFIASCDRGDTTTLGRGGSDYTAALWAAAVGAEELQIWTDVSGMYTSHPALVKQAKSIAQLSYEEAMELSHFGAKVLYPPTIWPVLEKGCPIRIKNTFAPEDAGTLIQAAENPDAKTVRGISHIQGISLLTLEGPDMVGIPGVSKRFFEALGQADVNVVLITQASSEHSICVGLMIEQLPQAEQAIKTEFEREIETGRLKELLIETELAVVALVGDNLKSHQGVSGRMFSALGKNNVNIHAIAQGGSERNISAVIAEKDVKKALNTLHETFFEVQTRQLNLFILGVGNVGARFLKQVEQQQEYLRENLRLQLRIIGLSNSRTMVFDEEGIALSDWEQGLADGQKANIDGFKEQLQSLNLRNSILVDNTASEAIARQYPDFLKRNVAVVTCNKIACSSELEYYTELKGLSSRYLSPFLFETNVGAGLPIIDTLRNLIISGDKVRKIQAVLSGSLNFVFNTFQEGDSFQAIVEEAKNQGFTEPDPRIDLSGVDVMRKILILARESGHALEMEEITSDSFLPASSLAADSVDDFMDTLGKEEEHFQQLLQAKPSPEHRLKYVASFEEGKASTGLQYIAPNHPFYELNGSDNIVLFFTDRYPEQPLIIKGAGAGADVTASGIFADIIRIGNF